MNKKFLILALLPIFFLGKGFLFAQNLMQYTSGIYNYSILIPEDWKRNDEIKNEKISLVLISGDNATLSVSFYKLKSLTADQFIAQYEKSLHDQLEELKLQEKGVIMARDDEAKYLIYDFLKGGEPYREKVCFYSRAKEIAIVMASMSEDKFHEKLPIFDNVFKSFTFETDQEKVEKED